MNEHNKLVSGVEATANPAPSTGRRRLVKGAMLATPAVMTLMSGRLMAATSMTCDQKLGELAPGGGWKNEDITLEIQLIDGKSVLGYYQNGEFKTDLTGLENLLPNSCYTSLYPNQ